MFLKDAIAAFNEAVARVIREEPSKVKAFDAEAMSDGSTATSIRASITKSDCKLSLVEDKHYVEYGTNDYPASAKYATNRSFLDWLMKNWLKFVPKDGVGDLLVAASDEKPMDLTVRPCFGTAVTAVVYGATEVAAVKAGPLYLFLVDMEKKEVYERTSPGAEWIKKPSSYDWKSSLHPNRWYSNITTGKLIYIGFDYECVLF